MPGDTIEISKIKDKEKYNSNYDSIDWGNLKDKPIEKKPETKKHATAGLCGEFGMSTFDEKAYKENFDQIDWNINGDRSLSPQRDSNESAALHTARDNEDAGQALPIATITKEEK